MAEWVTVYVPAHFAMTDDQVVDVLARMGSAELVTHHPGTGLVATNLPFLFDPGLGDRGALLGHVARNNRQWSDPVDGEALVIVTETDHYVSPAWLPSVIEHGRGVPTWDYVTVHVYGELVAHDDLEWTRDVVQRLTRRHEGRDGAATDPSDRPEGAPARISDRASGGPGWRVEDAAEGYVDAMLKAIVGIEVRITRITAKAKMAQNKAPVDVAALADVLAAQGDRHGAAWLREVSLPAAQRRAELLAEVATRRPPRED